MADKVTPERVKSLLSSFLSGISKFKSHKNAERPSPQKTSTIEKDKESEDTDTDSQEGKPDARDRDQFYSRVETYSPLTWFAKPLDLSPLMCARYGWENIDTDMLRCVSCRACLSGQLPKAVDTLVYKESYYKLKTNLVASHEKLCTWSSNPSPESFMLVPYHNKEELNKAVHKSLQSLIQAQSSLPTVTHTSFVEQLENEEVLTTMSECIQPQLEVAGTSLNQNICLLAITGWSYSSEHINILHCNYCRRRIGLWNYTHAIETKGTDSNQNSKEMNQNGTENVHIDEECKEPRRKRVKLEKQNFDPIAEHRYWCPWLQTESPSLHSKTTQIDIDSRTSLNSTPLKSPPSIKTSLLLSTPTDKSATDTETKKEPAWLIVMKILSNKDAQHGTSHDFQAKMKWSPQLEGVRHIRHMLKECTSPREYTSSSGEAKT